MTLDQAIDHVRAILGATPGAAETHFSRDAVRTLLQHVECDRIRLGARDVLTTPTLRDQFAMHAPIEPIPEASGENSAGLTMMRNRARAAYRYADAMMGARK